MCTNNKKCNCSCGSSYGGHPRPMLTYANGGQLYRLTQADLEEYNRRLGSRKSMALGGLSGSRQANEVNVGNSTNPFDYGQGQYGNVDTSFRDRKEGTFGEEVKDVGRTALKAQAGIAKGALDTLSYVLPGQAGEGFRQLNDKTLGRLSDANLGETSSKEQKRRTKIGDYSELGSEVLVGVAGTALTGDPRFAFAAAQSAGDTLGSDIDPGNKTLSTIGTGLQTAGGVGSTIYGATGGGGGGDYSEALSGAHTADIANSVEGGSDIVNATDAASSLPFAEGGDIKRLEAYMGSVREMAKGGQVNRKFLDANKIMSPGGPTDPPREEFLPKATEKKDIDYMPSIQPQQLDRINSSVRSKNPYSGDKGNTYLPLDFYYDWLNSSMYKDMMDGKESIEDKVKPIPSSIYKDDEETTQEFLQKFGYRPGLNGKLSVTDARKQNLENTKIENFEVSDYNNMALRGQQTTETAKDSEGNRIGEFPQITMQNPKFKYSDGDSISFDEYLSTLSHEFSHASDAEIIRYKASPSYYTSSAPEYYEYWGKPAPEGTFGLGQRDETVGHGKDLIPAEDLNLIKSFVEKNKEENFKGHYPEYSRNRKWDWKYVTEPTEVRARLNSQRYDLFRKRLFNPFTQKMTQDRLDKIREATIKSGSNDMKDLFNFFSDDQIIEMFNSIAMEKNIQEYPDGVQTAAYGGSIKTFAPGGPTDPPKYNTAPASSTAVNIQVPIENVQPQLNEPAVSPYAGQELRPAPEGTFVAPVASSTSPSLREVLMYGPGEKPSYVSSKDIDDDHYEPFLENVAEFFDPTGILSYDDAEAAYNRMKARGADTPNFDEALDMFGALPLVGKAKKAIVLAKGTKGAILLALQKAKVPFNKFLDWADRVNKADAVEDETDFLNKFQDWLKTVPPMSDNSSNTSPTNKMALGGRTNSPKKKISYEGRVPFNRKNSI